MNNLVKPNKPCTNRKPALTKWADGPWGPVRVRVFQNDSSLHCAFDEWNKAKSKNETLEVTITWQDGSEPSVDVLEHSTKTVEYKDYEGEVWELEQEISKWSMPDWSGETGLSQKGIREAYQKYHEKNGMVDWISSINFKVVPNE